MNNVLATIGLMLIFSILPSCHRKCGKSATIIRDCTGTYLRWNDADYYIVNDERTKAFGHNEVVKVTFKDVTKNADQMTFNNESNCMLYHAIEGFVEIKRIELK